MNTLAHSIHQFARGAFSTLILCLATSLYGQQSVRLLFVGDVMQHDTQVAGAWYEDQQRYIHTPWFAELRTFIEGADYAVANLELTLAGEPYKGYPRFSAPDGLALALRDVGFDFLLTANNHSCDRGGEGLGRTIDVLDSFGIPHTGTFKSKSERAATYPAMVSVQDMKIAILNYTYGTNGIPAPPPYVVNLLDTTMIRRDIQQAKAQGADAIVVAYHWGSEYKRLPNDHQKSLAKLAFRFGANVVIGAHPHVVQPMELNADGQLVAWSLGNFISNQRKQYTNGGAMIAFDLERKNGQVRVTRAGYVPVYVHRTTEDGRRRFVLKPPLGEADALNAPLMAAFMQETRAHLAAHNLNVPEWPLDSFAVNSNVTTADTHAAPTTLAEQRSRQKSAFDIQAEKGLSGIPLESGGETVYRIQILASATEQQLKLPKGWDEKIAHLFDGEWHRYFLGEFESSEEATAHLNEVQKAGYPDAFIRRFWRLEAE